MRNKQYPYYSVLEPTDLKNLLSICADTYADQTAFWYQRKRTEMRHSFLDLQNDVNALGTYLFSIGMHNSHIAILAENSYEWIISYFAIVNGGNVVVPIDKELDLDAISHLIKRADVSLLIHSENYADEAAALGIPALNMKDFAEYISFGEKTIADGNTEYLSHTIDREKMCAIVFTSGTTAQAKGVMLSQKNLISDAISTMKNIAVPCGSVLLLPLYHTYGWMSGVVLPILEGYPVYISSSMKRAFSDIKYAQPHHLSLVPVIIHAIYRSIWDTAEKSGQKKKLKNMVCISNCLRKIGIDARRRIFKQVLEQFGGNLEMIISGGAALDNSYIKGFEDLGIRVINGYGITEASPIVATVRNRYWAPKSVGCVQSCTDCRIVDGEIQLCGDSIFLGYYQNAAATEAAFDGKWFKTGDLGYLDRDGLLYITGRKKNTIVLSNGKNVSPEELEEKLLENEAISEVLVYGEEDRITAEIFPNAFGPDVEKIIRDIIAEQNRKLPSYKQIAAIKFRKSEFPKTSTGKIKRLKQGENDAGEVESDH